LRPGEKYKIDSQKKQELNVGILQKRIYGYYTRASENDGNAYQNRV